MPLLRFFMNRGVSLEDAIEATKFFRAKTLNESEYLLLPGDVSNEVCYMVTGLIRQFTQTEGLPEENVLFITEGRWAIERDSFFARTPSLTGMQAIETTALLSINYDDSILLLSKMPSMAALRMTLRGEGLGYLEQRQEWLNETNLPKRYHGMKAMLGPYGKSIPNKYLSSYIQINENELNFQN